jgi:DNA-binding winged helix-turn-helix (wHTH) protein
VTEHKSFVFRFGDIEVRESEFALARAGETVKVEPTAFRVLLYLLRHSGRLVTKDEIMAAVWPDTTVSDNSLTRCVATLRRLLDDSSREPRYSATVQTLGYRLLVPVEKFPVSSGAQSADRPEPAQQEDKRPGAADGPVAQPVTPLKRLASRWLMIPAGAALLVLDTFDDIERNLNIAVNKIREVLGDSAESPRFVETLPRRRYRLIGALEPVQPQAPVESMPAKNPRRRWRKIAAGVLAILSLASGTIVAYRWHRQQPPQQQEALAAVPFTALPGQETAPAFSPDGSRIAFAWNGDPAPGTKGFDLYVKAIGSETLLRLTRHPSEWISPAWSPDGTQIAFHRLAGADTGIYVVPALGGPERKFRSTQMPGIWGPLSMIGWSPDGNWIAFSTVSGDEHLKMSLLSTDTLETEQLPSDAICLEQAQPAFSHRGDHLAYWCYRTPGEAGL